MLVISLPYVIKLKPQVLLCRRRSEDTAAQSKGGELKHVQPGSFKQQSAAGNLGSCSLFRKRRAPASLTLATDLHLQHLSHIVDIIMFLNIYVIFTTDKQVFIAEAKVTGNTNRRRYQEVMFHSWGGNILIESVEMAQLCVDSKFLRSCVCHVLI